MGSYYKIGELSQLYGIGTDSLRYYEELGILSPKRGENGYRLYTINDIVKLNLLRDMRSIGFSVPQIKEHLQSYTVDSTVALLEREILLLQEKQRGLQALEEELHRRKAALVQASTTPRGEGFALKELPPRRIIKLRENIQRNEDVDYLLQKLKRGHEKVLYIIGNSRMGSTAELSQLERGEYAAFTSVFCLVPDHYEGDCDFLPAGRYFCAVHRGGYQTVKESMLALYAAAKQEGLQPAGEPIELYLVDNYDTGVEEEFVTELQIPVK